MQLLLFNEECLVGASHQLAPNKSLPFVVRGAHKKLVLVRSHGAPGDATTLRGSHRPPNPLHSLIAMGLRIGAIMNDAQPKSLV